MAIGKGDVPMGAFDALAIVEATTEMAEWNENAVRFAAHNYQGRR
jgi:hypothetical protein